MKNVKFFNYPILLILIVLTVNACSNDPVTSPQTGDGYQQVYYEAGVQDSLAVGTFLYDYLDLGNLDFTNSETIKISFDYVAFNAQTHRFFAYYYENYPNDLKILASFDNTGSQNTYKHVEFTAASPNASTIFYYVISRTGESYFVVRNLKISKK